MNHSQLPFAVSYATALFGGILMFVGAFTARGRLAPHWIRVGCWLCAPLVLVWSTLGFTIHFESAALSKPTYDLLHHYKDLVGGMVGGILLLLFVSGEFFSASSHPKTNTD